MGVRAKLSDDTVRYVLKSEATDAHLSRELYVSRQTISNIRRGSSYKHVSPEIERRNPNTRLYQCIDCRHWDSTKIECDLSFPEPRKNIWFASECSLYFANNA
jgi:hypothetical protein